MIGTGTRNRTLLLGLWTPCRPRTPGSEKPLVRPGGFEPPSNWLKASHSAVELRAYIIFVLLELVAPGRFELPLDGISVRCLCQLGYGATYYLERPAGLEPAPQAWKAHMLPLNTTVALIGAPSPNRTNALPGFNGTLYLLSYRST